MILEWEKALLSSFRIGVAFDPDLPKHFLHQKHCICHEMVNTLRIVTALLMSDPSARLGSDAEQLLALHSVVPTKVHHL